jgi:hypothetical protein
LHSTPFFLHLHLLLEKFDLHEHLKIPIPTCAWCRIDTLFIWKICNRHRGTVPQKDFLSYAHSKSSNKSDLFIL